MSALLFEKTGHVVALTINRPETRNPLGEEGDGELFAEAVERINTDTDVRCVILTGAGKAFSAGGNVKAMRARAGSFAGCRCARSANATAPAFIAWCARCGTSTCR